MLAIAFIFFGADATSGVVVDVESFVLPEHLGDISLAVTRAQESLPPSGGTIRFNDKFYVAKTSIRLTRPTTILGAATPWGGTSKLPYSGTRIEARNCTAIIIERAASFSRINGVGLSYTGTSTSADGIVCNGRPYIDHVVISHFPNRGIVIDCDVLRNPSTNANGWSLSNIRIEDIGHDSNPWREGNGNSCGLYVNGGDANAGVAIALDINSCKGWSVCDSSYLGNTYVGSHAATGIIGNWRSEGRSNRTTFVGVYSEGEALNVGSPRSLWINCRCARIEGGAVLSAELNKLVLERISFTNDTDPADTANFEAGKLEDEIAGVAARVTASADSGHGYVLKHCVTGGVTGTWSWLYKRRNEAAAFGMTTDNHPRGGGHGIAANGILLANQRHQSAATKPADSVGLNGDIMWSTANSGPLYWRKRAGVWRDSLEQIP